MGGSVAAGQYSTAMNKGITDYGYSLTAIGANTLAWGLGQIAVGTNNVAHGNSVDNFNWSWVPTEDLFIIGNGSLAMDWETNTWTPGPPSNALVVRKNGDTRVAGNLQVKGGIRVAPSGDISMGDFHTGDNPATLNSGLRYETE